APPARRRAPPASRRTPAWPTCRPATPAWSAGGRPAGSWASLQGSFRLTRGDRTDRAGDAEADTEAARVARRAQPLGRAAVGGAVVPRAAAQHAQGAALRPRRVAARPASIIRLVVVVGDPVPDVAVHVVQAEGVGRVLAAAP